VDTSQPNFPIVAYPFDKFFNLSESNAAPVQFDQKTTCIFEKLDGSICTIYHYADEWHVASSGMPDASGMIKGRTFSNLFWKIWDEKGMKLPQDVSRCYFFEMCTDENRIVVPYPEDRIVLIGARDLITLQEFAHKELCEMGEQHNWEVIQRTCLHAESLADVREAAEKLDPVQSEGFVVCDASFNRVKIKSPQYVSLTRLNIKRPMSANLDQMYAVLRVNEQSEFLTYFPQFKKIYQEAKKRYRFFCEVMKILVDVRRRGIGEGALEALLCKVFGWNQVTKKNVFVVNLLERLNVDREISLSEALGQIRMKKLRPLIEHVNAFEEDVTVALFLDKTKTKNWEDQLMSALAQSTDKGKSAKDLRKERRIAKQRAKEEQKKRDLEEDHVVG